MLMAVDLGNTQTVVGFYAEGNWSELSRFSSQKAEDALWLKRELATFIVEAEQSAGRKLSRFVLGSVVPALNQNYSEALQDLHIEQKLLVNSKLDVGLEIELENRDEVGADRIANALAALKIYGPKTIVVDFGTATNMDVVDAEGRYLGGLISPGLETSIWALYSRAAKLKNITLEVPTRAIGRNTKEALESGFYFGEVAKVEGLVARIQAELGSDCTLVTTGGLSVPLTPLLIGDYVIDQTLTLEGLRLIALLNPDVNNV